MKLEDSTFYLLETCLRLFRWEADNRYERGKEYDFLLDIIVLLDKKLLEVVTADEIQRLRKNTNQ